jgi:hypothetical protein
MDEARADYPFGKTKRKFDRINDVLSEMSLAPFLGREFRGETPGDASIYHMRISPYAEARLPLYRPDGAVYLLARVDGKLRDEERPRGVWLTGWLVADLAWLEMNNVQWGKHHVNAKYPAWWVEQEQLRDWEELKALDCFRAHGEDITIDELLGRVGRSSPVLPLDDVARSGLAGLEQYLTSLRQIRQRWCSQLLAGWPESSRFVTAFEKEEKTNPGGAPDWARDLIKLELTYALKHTGYRPADIDGAGEWLKWGVKEGVLPRSRGTVAGVDRQTSDAEMVRAEQITHRRTEEAARTGARPRYHCGPIDIRTMDTGDARLPIHDSDLGGIFVLVVAPNGRDTSLRGWCVADRGWLEHEVMKGRIPDGSPMERTEGEAWWVEQDQLRPMEEILCLTRLIGEDESETITARELLGRVGRRRPPRGSLTPEQERYFPRLEEYVASLRKH